MTPHQPRNATGVAGNVRAEMARRRMTTVAMAKATDIPETTLGRKLRGSSSFTVEQLTRIAKALDVAITDLLVGS